MTRSPFEKATLALESLTDSCEMLSNYSAGMVRGDGYDAYLVPETFWYHRVRLHAELGEKLGETVQSIGQQTKDGKLPRLLCYLESEYADDQIAPLLTEAGYIPFVVQQAMYMPLGERSAAAVPAQLEYVPLEEMDDWIAMIGTAFGKPSDPGLKMLHGNDACTFLQWREDGKVVAGMLLICKDGNAGIHEVGTLAEYRGKGIASALLNHALDLGAKQGCNCATLQASPLGEPVYKKLGMDIYSQVRNWMLP